ncbi:hypothetical protein MVEG_01174 [Podila verticillata NRRL 6337]|nr:hypothetical protein MVEG_01174 [Podila verticillata NRRL 6337]
MSISTHRESDNTIASIPSSPGSGSGSSSTQPPSFTALSPQPPQTPSQPSSAPAPAPAPAPPRAFFLIGGRIGARSSLPTPGLVNRGRGSSSEKEATLVNIPGSEPPTNEKLTQGALEDIDNKDHPKETSGDDHHHHHPHISLTDRLHFHRPDRHLFPYRSAKENWRAARTFLRRFFLLFLIIPAWVVPNVLKAKAERDLALHGGQEGGHGEGGGHGVELRKGENLVVFFLNMLVMMHLGKAAGAALEELVPRFGMSIVSVLDAFTSTVVELAVAAFALRKGLIKVVQAAMLGAILNNLLLVMGIAITVGGIYNHQQQLKKETTQTAINILMLCTIAYVIPVALDYSLFNVHKKLLPTFTDPAQILQQRVAIQTLVDKDILTLSKIMAVIMLVVYLCCLLYQYHSRTFMVTPEEKHEGPHTLERRYTHFWFAGLAFVVTMAAQIYSANLLVHAVETLGRQYHLNDSFVGFVLLPIVLVADLQEEVIAIRESRANRLDKCVSLMVGSCMQIALLVTPVLVLVGWFLGEPMTFRFTVMEVVILVGSVLIINYMISDSETNWLEGMVLLALFMICAVAFYYDLSPLETLPSEGNTISGEGGH